MYGDLGVLLLLGAAGVLFLMNSKTAIVAVAPTPGPGSTGTSSVGGYDCFDQQEDEIPLHCCRYKAKPSEESYCKTSQETGEFLKCCRNDKKAWGGLF